MVMAQYDGAVEQGEADAQAVEREERKYRPQKHALKQIIKRAEQQAPEPVPVAQDGFRLSIEGPPRAYRHC